LISAVCGAVDVQSIDLFWFDNADADPERRRVDLFRQLFAERGAELFGIIHPAQPNVLRQNDRSSKHRPRERADPHLVDAGDIRDPRAPEATLDPQQDAEPCCLPPLPLAHHHAHPVPQTSDHSFPSQSSAVPTISAKAHFHTLPPTRRQFAEPIRANKLERHQSSAMATNSAVTRAFGPLRLEMEGYTPQNLMTVDDHRSSTLFSLPGSPQGALGM
jgi:hypothetical protein